MSLPLNYIFKFSEALKVTIFVWLLHEYMDTFPTFPAFILRPCFNSAKQLQMSGNPSRVPKKGRLCRKSLHTLHDASLLLRVKGVGTNNHRSMLYMLIKRNSFGSPASS